MPVTEPAKPAAQPQQPEVRVVQVNASRARAKGNRPLGTLFDSTESDKAQVPTTPSARHAAKLSTTRALARRLTENNDISHSFVRVMSDFVDVPNMRLVPEPTNASGNVNKRLANRLRSQWNRWSEDADTCDYSNRHTFKEMVGLTLNSRLVDGEGFIRLEQTQDNRLQLELIDAERVPSGYEANRYGGVGAQIDDRGRVTNWVVGGRPPLLPTANGIDLYGYRVAEYQLIPRDAFVQFAELSRVDQYRGLPPLLPVIQAAATLNDYTAFALENANIASRVFAFVKDAPNSGNLPGEIEAQNLQEAYDKDGLSLSRLPTGSEISTSRGSYPANEFGPFVNLYLSLVSSSLGVPSYFLTGNMQGFNFSSARVMSLRFKRTLSTERAILERGLSRIYNMWIRLEQSAGRLPDVAGLDNHRWEWTSLEHIQPREAVTASVMKIDAGISTPYGEIVELGGDPLKVAAQKKLSQELGLVKLQETQQSDEPQDDD